MSFQSDQRFEECLKLYQDLRIYGNEAEQCEISNLSETSEVSEFSEEPPGYEDALDSYIKHYTTLDRQTSRLNAYPIVITVAFLTFLGCISVILFISAIFTCSLYSKACFFQY